MKKGKIKKAFKGIFKSIGDDFVNLFKKHYLKLIGYIIMLIIPLVFIVSTYIYKRSTLWALPVFVWIPIAIFIIVYWFKLRTYLAIKVNGMEIENHAEAGKHAGLIIIIKVLQCLMTIAPFLLCYFVFKRIEEASIKVENIFLFLTLCESLGSVFIILDTIKNVVNYNETE